MKKHLFARLFALLCAAVIMTAAVPSPALAATSGSGDGKTVTITQTIVVGSEEITDDTASEETPIETDAIPAYEKDSRNWAMPVTIVLLVIVISVFVVSNKRKKNGGTWK